MGRASACLHNLFTKSTTQINNNNNHTANNFKPKWVTTLIKSCKYTNRSATANSVVSVAICSKTIASRDNEQSAIVVDEKPDNKADNAASKKAVVEAVRATRSGRVDFDRSRRAAVVIQSVFRGYLARKALRALRALVRLQALVRGYIVRKQAVDQVWRMQALIRAQARARAIRAPVPASSYSSSGTSHSCVLDPPTTEYTEYYSSREWSCKGQDPSVKNQLLQRNSSKSDTKNLPDHQIKLGSGRTFSRRFDSEKISRAVEVDSSAKSYNLTKDNNLFVLSDYISHNVYRTSGIPHPAEDLYLQYSNEIDRYSFYTTDDIIPPAHTGSFRSSSARRGGYNVLPNVNYSESYLSYHPNYMAYTQSSKAKMRSLSAPRQRTQLDRSTSPKCYSSHDYGSRRLSASGLS